MDSTKPAYDVRNHQVVSSDDWTRARKTLLAKEKEFTKARDALSQARRDLPWERVEKEYVFDGPDGKKTLTELFGDSNQLIVYHFMFDENEDEGCKHCSFWADTFNGIPLHLRARDTAFVAISRVPLAKVEAYRKRMGWGFRWLSSYATGFNRDLGVTFTEDEIENGRALYNYELQDSPDTEREGISVFFKDGKGHVYHTYSAYARGIDIVNSAYNFLDLTPKGRDEADGPQRWVRRHDEYTG
jgi:predicted dithiol-disulfide oxidoreductase (DUF899 family)